MIGIIHQNWDSDIILEKGDLEKLISGETLEGDIADYPKLRELKLSLNKEVVAPAHYFNLIWNKENPSNYHFEVYEEGIEKLKSNQRVYGRYKNGLNGSKLDIYCEGKDEFIEDNIRFAIQMIKLESKK